MISISVVTFQEDSPLESEAHFTSHQHKRGTNTLSGFYLACKNDKKKDDRQYKSITPTWNSLSSMWFHGHKSNINAAHLFFWSFIHACFVLEFRLVQNLLNFELPYFGILTIPREQGTR